jgi:formylglycine-generating enzyme required for sulfatase activity/serine/threonine protein kinase
MRSCSTPSGRAQSVRQAVSYAPMSTDKAAAETTTPDGGEPARRTSDSRSYAARALERLAQRTRPFGRYDVQGEVARGGQGAVLRVRDQDLDRDLAMKVVHGQEALAQGETRPVDSLTLGRFIEEAQVTGRLDHPGIVPVHELGLDAEGRVYFTMKLVKGEDLSAIFEKVRTGREGWTLTRALGVLTKVCEAMAYAHAKQVIHRDLKPANIMVGKFGEVYVMDWGLARVLNAEDHHDLRIQPTLMTSEMRSERHDASSPDSPLVTMDGDVVGTPVYMSPEQATGKLDRMGPHSDVYSLGAMLYELCAGHMPYVRPDMMLSARAVWYRVQEGPPEALQKRAPRTPPELVAICERAMAREVEARYRDTSELAADLAAFLEQRVVSAFETGGWAEARKWVQRNRALAAALAAAVLLLLVGLATALFLRQEAQDNLDLAERRANELVRERNSVLRLSALGELADLRAQADELWPAVPERIDAYHAWLERARALVAGLEPGADGDIGHRAQLAELRGRARQLTPEEIQRDRETHPRFAELLTLEGELAASRSAQAVRAGGPAPSPPTLAPSVTLLAPYTLRTMANHWSAPDRKVFGREADALALAEAAFEQSGLPVDRFTVAWALHALGRDDDAVEQARLGISAAAPEEAPELEASLERLLEEISAAQGERGERRLAELQAETGRLRAEVDARRAFPLDSEQDRWWHTQLSKLVDEIEAFADAETGLIDGDSLDHGAGIARRLRTAEELRAGYAAGGKHALRWERALPAIHAAYPGTTLSVQVGLVPIGTDPVSGLWEFWHLGTGAEPLRDADGVLRMTEESGVVLVLLPGGSFWMGGQSRDPEGQNYNVTGSSMTESPVHEVTLSPFFLSKFELTQGQWKRFTGSNPSGQGPDGDWRASYRSDGEPPSYLHPVENVSWHECLRELRRMGLSLPSEAQWEYAARAGTTGPWWTGSDELAVTSAANVADRYARDNDGSRGWVYEEDLYDGFTYHAPVGTFAANPFGLHEVHGNVREWVLDGYHSFFYLRSPTSDPVAPTMGAPTCVYRGGSFADTADRTTSSLRYETVPTREDDRTGVRPARAVTR